MSADRHELLEIYKLHAELADRVSQRREEANRLYVGLLTGLSVVFAVLLEYGAETIPVWLTMLVAGVIGGLLSISWFIVVRSYRQLNTGKFATLLELEQKLAHAFFKREWELLERGENISRYWKLTVVETILPVGFFILSGLLTLAAILIM